MLLINSISKAFGCPALSVLSYPVPNPGSWDPTQPPEECEHHDWAPEHGRRTKLPTMLLSQAPPSCCPMLCPLGTDWEAVHLSMPMCRQTPGLATLAFVTKWLADYISSPPVLVTTIRLWKVPLALPLRKCSGPASSSPFWSVQ